MLANTTTEMLKGVNKEAENTKVNDNSNNLRSLDNIGSRYSALIAYIYRFIYIAHTYI